MPEPRDPTSQYDMSQEDSGTLEAVDQAMARVTAASWEELLDLWSGVRSAWDDAFEGLEVFRGKLVRPAPRLAISHIFHALLPLLPTLELAGEPEMVPRNLHVGGIKRLLVRTQAN